MIRPHDTNHPFNCPISYISRRSVAKDKQKGPDPAVRRRIEQLLEDREIAKQFEL